MRRRGYGGAWTFPDLGLARNLAARGWVVAVRRSQLLPTHQRMRPAWLNQRSLACIMMLSRDTQYRNFTVVSK